MNPIYCNSLTAWSRFRTREVKCGDVGIGGENPIRIQTMTTTDTMDTAATVAQSIRCIEAGSELIRITAPSIHEAKNLENISRELRRRGYRTPIVADIHFTPNAAEIAARLVEKVRINPGNYIDKKKFLFHEYSDAGYHQDLEKIRERFVPLVRICKEYGTAIRIGTNHGSLSDRIMSRYGDTPLGMVESALEFVRFAEDEGFYHIVLSMKASNPQVMIQAYRLLVHHMMESNRNYPLHLGVTEAGDGEDGRIKSAIGIGTLLEDGLGDTIRVSLTEDPELEIPVARMLANRYKPERTVPVMPSIRIPPHHPFEYKRQLSGAVENIGGSKPPVVVLDLSEVESITPDTLIFAGYVYDAATDKWHIGDQAADYLFTGNLQVDFELPGTLGIIQNISALMETHSARRYPLYTVSQFLEAQMHQPGFVLLSLGDVSEALLDKLREQSNAVIVVETDHENGMTEQRRLLIELNREKINNPVIIRRRFLQATADELILRAATDLGALLIDGFGDGIWITAPRQVPSFLSRLSFGILQGCRLRISKTEYISCPSCGRTLFDLQETTSKIRSRTGHLKGVKIAIMGCIVNGPGEMADADYGYVGSGGGKIRLYKGKEVVKRSLDAEDAVDALIELIRENGDWVDAPSNPAGQPA